jgi:hypothetical protein
MALFRRKSESKDVDPEARSPKTGVKYKDLDVVGLLVKHGADFTQPRHVLYYMYFDSSEVATHAADEARSHSFEASVKEPLPQYPGRWSLTCERHGIVLDFETIRNNGDYFEGLAAHFGGEYDGWEASVR